jgi:hypothetical protein
MLNWIRDVGDGLQRQTQRMPFGHCALYSFEPCVLLLRKHSIAVCQSGVLPLVLVLVLMLVLVLVAAAVLAAEVLVRLDRRN